MKRWTVPPTMVRGSAQPKTNLAYAKVRKDPPAGEGQSKKKKAKMDVDHINLDIGPGSIGRNQAGSEAIRTLMEENQRIFEARFPNIRLFDDNGACRMKFDGAQKVTFADIVAGSPEAFDKMFLSWVDWE